MAAVPVATETPAPETDEQRMDRYRAKYVAAYEKGMRENPEGWRHAGCSHADGICSG